MSTPYIFTIKLTTPKGHEIGIDPDQLYGYWLKPDGSDGGGLWFEKTDEIGTTGIGQCLELMDYDGCYALPAQVYIKLLNQPNMIIDASFGPDDTEI